MTKEQFNERVRNYKMRSISALNSSGEYFSSNDFVNIGESQCQCFNVKDFSPFDFLWYSRKLQQVYNAKTDHIYNKEIRSFGRPNQNSGKYERISLSVFPGIKVNVIHAILFIYNEDSENLRVVDHIDDNGINNEESNLQWISRIDNLRKKNFDNYIEYGKILTNDEIYDILNSFSNGTPQLDLATKYNRTIVRISQICSLVNCNKAINILKNDKDLRERF